MRKLIITVIICLTVFFTNNIGHTSDFANITKNTQIAAALTALENVGRGDVISILNGKNATDSLSE